MLDITKVDANFALGTKINKTDIKFYTADDAPFCIYGIFRENGKYRRMPESVANTVNDNVRALHANTAGGRVRFVTDSPYVAIHAKMDTLWKMSDFALTGAVGFDLYADNFYKGTFIPPFDIVDEYEGIVEFPTKEKREITINFPLYADVKTLYIGLQEGATNAEPSPYKNEKPIVYYGSSITQGAAASRPGACYPAILSRRFQYDYVNLGFSGGAKGETEIAEYIAGLEMSAFVLDYDYNARSVADLEATHEKLFRTVRAKHPEIPVILLSRPKHFPIPVEVELRSVIETTYKNALLSGDKNVYFLDGAALTALCRDEGTVDTIHPSDFGFASMAQAIGNVMENILIF